MISSEGNGAVEEMSGEADIDDGIHRFLSNLEESAEYIGTVATPACLNKEEVCRMIAQSARRWKARTEVLTIG